MSVFPFQVNWDYYGVECNRGFDHKNEAIQEAHSHMGEPGVENVRTQYIDEDGHAYFVIEGCE